MNYTKDGKVNTQYARLIEWLEDMGVPTEQREQYAKDIIKDVEANAQAAYVNKNGSVVYYD